jgi:TatD DNase family protein
MASEASRAAGLSGQGGAGRLRWFDTHVHLERYAGRARQPMLARAVRASVTGVLAVSTGVESSRRTARLGPRQPKCVGIHPREAAGEEGVDEIARLAATAGVVAIGEAGFDGAGPPLDVQAATFTAQCALARRLGLTFVLHVDRAWEALVAAAEALDGLTVVRHYFTGTAAEAEWHAERGHYLSFGRPLLRSEDVRLVAARYPARLLLVETDSYPLPGRATEPMHLVEGAACLADVRGWSLEECSAQLWENTADAFPRLGLVALE